MQKVYSLSIEGGYIEAKLFILGILCLKYTLSRGEPKLPLTYLLHLHFTRILDLVTIFFVVRRQFGSPRVVWGITLA